MPRTSANEIEKLFAQHKFISYSEGAHAVAKVQQSLPQGLLETFKLLLKPSLLLSWLKLQWLLRNFERYRSEHNSEFIEVELANTHDFFKDIEWGLDEQQKRAVLADEDNALVIAGAGSGKTTTMVGKVRYLTERMGVEPSAILPISFTRKSAESLKKRIDVPGVNSQTFHKFGLSVLTAVERRRPAIFDDANPQKLFIGFIESLAKDEEYLANLTSFFINYSKVPRSQFEFDSLGDYIQYLKDQDYTTYRRTQIPHRGKDTFMSETVKSVEECMIANFLTFCRVTYDYERPYDFPHGRPGTRKSYKPDFSLGNGIYLEHFGVDRNGNVPAFFAGPDESPPEATRKYQKSMQWKRALHKANGTTLIETYSYQFMDGTLITELAKQLESTGITLDPMTPKEVWALLQDSGKDEVDGFINLTLTFLSLLKSNHLSIEAVIRRIETSENSEFLKTRARQFIHLFRPLYEMYEEHLTANHMIDFSDMITRASEYIENGAYQRRLRYVIIDEFQDLSIGRYRLLQAIMKQNPGVKLYCVGDDWQSIFRFTGSDIALFRDYEHYFGYTYRARIETTYRFNDPLISLSSGFILKNPNQASKTLVAPKGAPPTSYSIVESEGFDNDDTAAVEKAINNMVDEGLTPRSSVYIIGRYNFDLARLKNKPRSFVVSQASEAITYTFPDGPFKGDAIEMQFLTAHRAKGLEADYVIVINCNSGKYGFPSGKADDPILNLLLSSADQFENGEERRLFYVAITRARRHVTLVTDKYKKSKFIKELQDDFEGRELTCPRCGSGELVLRSGSSKGRPYRFYGCSNFAYGCDYTTNTLPAKASTQRRDRQSAMVMPAIKPIAYDLQAYSSKSVPPSENKNY